MFLIYFEHFYKIEFLRNIKKEILLFDYIFDDYMKKVLRIRLRFYILRLEKFKIFLLFIKFFLNMD